MDSRLLEIIACPACRSTLSFAESNLACPECALTYPVTDGVPELVEPGANRDGAFSEDWARTAAEWIGQQFRGWQSRGLEAAEVSIVGALRCVEGPVLDVASGPGGSLCVPLMMDGRTDRILIMSDLGAPVMPAWRRVLDAAGWGDRCSTVTCDARRLPFRDATLGAVSSVGGFDNIFGNRSAYEEAARTLIPGGPLLDVARFYEDGGPTYRRLADTGQAAASRPVYESLLSELGFRLDRREVVFAGRGKSDPRDGLPLGDEAWENVAVFATRM